MAWRLVVVLGEHVTRHELALGEHVLGSLSGVAVRVVDPSVSRRHARIRVTRDGVFVEDLGSRNGTRRSGQRVERTAWPGGETLLFGRVPVRLEEVEQEDLEAGLVLTGAPPTTGEAASVEPDHTTHGSSPVDAFVLEHLPALLTAVMQGAGGELVAARLGASLMAALPAASVSIVDTGGGQEGLLFESARGVEQSAVEASASCGRFTIRLGFSAPPLARRYQPLAVVAAALVAISERSGVPRPGQPPSTAHGPALPDPPSVVAAVCDLYAQARRVARGDVSVLILGESGTGKEVLARFIHAASSRHSGPFLGLNCAALGRDLLEAELFGVEKGAATGVDARPGKFELAHGGTLFLDEIGDMPTDTQAKILRVLQAGEVFRLGAREPHIVSVRVVAATNRDLEGLLSGGGFRRDLYHRIAGWVVELPPLRRRVQDIPNLAVYFLSREAARIGVRVSGISRAALAALVAYRWPGNIRELELEMARAALFLEDGELLDTSRLAAQVSGARSSRGRCSLAETLADVERAEITRALSEASGEVGVAASRLGISRATLYRRIKELGCEARPAGS